MTTTWTRIAKQVDGTYRTDNVNGAIDLLKKRGWQWYMTTRREYTAEVARLKRGMTVRGEIDYGYIPKGGEDWSIAIVYKNGKIVVCGPEAGELRRILEANE